MSSLSSVDFNEKPIESEVFRFVSVRNPQRITKTQLNRLAVPYPGGDNSDLYDDLVAAINDAANASGAEKLAACKVLASNYKASSAWIANVDALNALVPGLEGIYDWLQANYKSLTIAAVTAKLTGIEVPDNAILGQIWDNLLAQLILGGGGPTRAALMEVLVLSNLLLNYLDEDLVSTDAELRIMVNARVILPEAIFPLPGTNVVAESPIRIPADDAEAQKQKQVEKLMAYQAVLEELEDIRCRFQEEIDAIPPQPQQGPIVLTAETVLPNLNFCAHPSGL